MNRMYFHLRNAAFCSLSTNR